MGVNRAHVTPAQPQEPRSRQLQGTRVACGDRWESSCCLGPLGRHGLWTPASPRCTPVLRPWGHVLKPAPCFSGCETRVPACLTVHACDAWPGTVCDGGGVQHLVLPLGPWPQTQPPSWLHLALRHFISFKTSLQGGSGPWRSRIGCFSTLLGSGAAAYLSTDSGVPSGLCRCSGMGSSVFPLILPPITSISFFSLWTCFTMSSDTTWGHPLMSSLWVNRE